MLGYETYEILANIFTNPEREDFDTLVDRLTNNFHPKSSIVAEENMFGCHRKRDSESLADFIANLRRHSARCNFNALDENLCDRFVCGLIQEYIQRMLVMERDDHSFD